MSGRPVASDDPDEGAGGAARGPAAPTSRPPNPLELLQSRGYVGLLIIGALVGVPVAVIAYYFLKWVADVQKYFFTTLPHDLGFSTVPGWWPLPMVALCGLLVGLTLRHLPGPGGHNPAEGFKAGGKFTARDLPSIIVASFVTLSLGAVLGPEAPLVLIGAGVAVLIVQLLKRDLPERAIAIIGAAGSFAAISTLLISPIAGAFLLLEAAGIGGGLISVIMAPGMVAAGTGALVFIGLADLSGTGTYGLAVPNLPPVALPTFVEFLWAIAIGLLAAMLGIAIRRLAFQIQPWIVGRKVLMTTLLGVVIASLAIIFDQVTGKGTNQVLFSGENALAPLLENAASWSVGALVLLVVCKGLAYSASLAGFRGGPTFPGMFIGAAGGIALSHVGGLPTIAGAGMGIGAMTVVMLGGLPLSAVMLTLLFLQSDALDLISVVIIAIMVAYVASARLNRFLKPAPAASGHRETPPGSEGAGAAALPAG